jgi:hypothetical protein
MMTMTNLARGGRWGFHILASYFTGKGVFQVEVKVVSNPRSKETGL